MKNWLYLPLLLLAVVFSSCTKTTNEVVIPNKTIFFDVAPNSWILDGDVYFVQFKDLPELTSDANQVDGVVVSVSRQSNGAYSFYELLPEVFNNEYYNVIHETGKVTIELRGPNGTKAQVPNVNMRFKVVIVPSVQN
ncbi:hypothetical protein [Chitinophaga qingshengii]|uniref:Uncharacterized protein n=1 Tax=Chitinophaga qingshengii TaxID=1569794 RepID=A0ABR7TQV4_9BACT|nr:hypothetical protein [Chitinophaga qingshengii]MBC9932373.1 hypothetical protein [Chitinophaga qingshengii]